MSSGNKFLAAALSLGLIAAALPARAADLSCNGLVPLGSRMICPGFEPNWAIEFICDGEEMTSNFVDAFSGSEIINTPGRVSFLSEKPWGFSTDHGITGLVAYTPGACQDESDRLFDFTLTTTEVPGYTGEIAPICCRIE